MLTEIIFWTGVTLLALLLLRAIRGNWVRRFPVFFSYNLFVFMESLVLYVLYKEYPERYVSAYWTCEFVGVLLGTLVLFELYRVTLRAYPGTARMARNMLCLVFALACAKVMANLSYGPAWWPAKDVAEIERNLRAVQGFAILALILVIAGYAIPRDRQLKGILAGYTLLVANSIVQLSLLSHLGASFQRIVVYLQPITYDLVVCIWVVALWPRVAAGDGPTGKPEVSSDHETLVSRARRELQEIRHGLPGAAPR
jgi:hypothetical protein